MPSSAPAVARPISGVCPVLATPFDDNGAPDAPGLARIAEFAIRSGADALVYPGVASEVEQLSDSERNDLLDGLATAVHRRVPLIVGATAAHLPAAIRHLHKAASLGAAAAMVMAPARLAGDTAALIDYYRSLGAATDVPIMLQNAPPPAGAGIHMSAIAQVVGEVPAVRYVKEETMPCGQRISALLATREIGDAPHFIGVLGGAGGRYILDELARGALGTMPACELTDIHVEMVAAWRAGNRGFARTLYNRSLPLLNFQAVFRWAMTKEVLKRRGIIEGAHVRASGPRLDRQDEMELGVMLAEISDLLADFSTRGEVGIAATNADSDQEEAR
jgi:4-hydroxy-tetrahydrodipicolinate synthase